MAKLSKDLENEKNMFYAECYAKAIEKYKNYVVVHTCYGDFFLKHQIDNKTKKDKEIDFLKILLEEIYYVEDGMGLCCIEEGEKLLKKLGYEIVHIIVYDDKYLSFVPVHLRSVGEASMNADKMLLLKLDRNQKARASSWSDAGKSIVI